MVVLDAVLRAGLSDRDALAGSMARRRGRRGVVTARAALAHADPRAESPMETRLRLLLVLAGLPAPAPQHVVRHPDGRFVARVDLAYVEQRLAIEYDGRDAHVEPGRFQHDRHRHHDLREAGWEVLRFTGEDTGRGRVATADRVRRTLARLPPGPPARGGGVVVPRW